MSIGVVGVAVGKQQQARADIAREPVIDVAEDQHLAGAQQLGFNPADEVCLNSPDCCSGASFRHVQLLARE